MEVFIKSNAKPSCIPLTTLLGTFFSINLIPLAIPVAKNVTPKIIPEATLHLYLSLQQ